MNLNRLVAIGCCIVLASLPGCSRVSDKADVRFAKTLFLSMLNGTAAESAIDWEVFHTDEEDVGAAYKALPNEEEKASFRKSFLIGFAASTPNLKANLAGVTSWRVKSATPSETTVAVDVKWGVISLTVSKRDGNQKLSAIRVEK
jgi:hypothetical protein